MTLALVDAPGREESPNDAVRRRLRGELAQIELSVNRLAKLLGVTQPALHRRMSGQTLFDLDLVARIAQATGIDYVYLVTGIKETARPRGPGGQLNSQPSHYKGYSSDVPDLGERRAARRTQNAPAVAA